MVLEENGEDKMVRESNEEVLERIGEKRKILNNFIRIKINWICHIVRRYCLLHDAIEGQMTEVKGVGRRITTQLHDELRNRRKYCKRKGEAEDRERWKRQFFNRNTNYLPLVHGSANKQHI